MIGIDDLLGRFVGLERAELTRWVENRWVLPDESGGRWVFREVDIARVELILHVRRDFSVGDEAMEVLLGLLDQVYSLRRRLTRLADALAQQPPEVQAAIRRALAEE
ncbi:MAG TPA: chaperone modulator CbpM [Stellaceae bacterium]|jgi:chaperone modulatory protein CbpM